MAVAMDKKASHGWSSETTSQCKGFSWYCCQYMKQRQGPSTMAATAAIMTQHQVLVMFFVVVVCVVFLVLQVRDASDISSCIHVQRLIWKLVQRARSKMSFQRLLFLTRYALFLFKDTVPKTLLILKDYTLCIILWHRDKPSTATHGTA